MKYNLQTFLFLTRCLPTISPAYSQIHYWLFCSQSQKPVKTPASVAGPAQEVFGAKTSCEEQHHYHLTSDVSPWRRSSGHHIGAARVAYCTCSLIQFWLSGDVTKTEMAPDLKNKSIVDIRKIMTAPVSIGWEVRWESVQPLATPHHRWAWSGVICCEDHMDHWMYT